jgi:hypothetical protein
MGIKCRLITPIAQSVYLRAYWTDETKPCISRYGKYHNATNKLHDTSIDDVIVRRSPKEGEFDISLYPTKCDHCGIEVPTTAELQISSKTVYDNETGDPQPGDMYWSSWVHNSDSKKSLCKWDNCDDPRGHLIVVLPNGQTWDLMSRASNCTMKEDRLHRCWVVHGLDNIPHLHVDKNGHTCAAGAGSILVGDYHGFLHNGELNPC